MSNEWKTTTGDENSSHNTHYSLLTIRPAVADDFAACYAIDHRYRSARVWQIDLSGADHLRAIRFQIVRLPRRMTIDYPYTREEMVERWCEADLALVAEDDDFIAGYLTLIVDRMEPVAWLNDLVITPDLRRQGIGGDLLAFAAQWARQKGLRRLMTKMQTKNEPGIAFLENKGFNFCGYNEFHFRNEEIALYFALKL